MDETQSDYQKNYRKQYAKSHRRISISVSNDEYKAFSHLANKEKTKVTTLIKDFAFAGLSGNLAVPKDLKKELQELKFLIRNIANNVNQAAHYSHTIRALADENGLLNQIKQLEETVQDFVQEKMKP
ncbi:MAG: hypothetical protein HQL46_02545 [Gammaproteobacteria bacterium]|nr:hypothetical protein [Gammaproteobacteria bacterium]